MNKHVLVTKVDEQASAQLVEYFKAQSDYVVRWPAMDFEVHPLPHHELQQIKKENMCHLVFISPRSVEYFCQQLGACDLRCYQAWPAIAPGPATAKTLEAYGFSQVLMPKCEFNEQGIIAMPQLQALPGGALIWVNGLGKKTVPRSIFHSRGARFYHWPVYRRIFPKASLWDQVDLQHGSFDLVIATSLQGLKHIRQALEGRDCLSHNAAVTVMNEAMAELASSMGFTSMIKVQCPTNSDMIEAIQFWEQQHDRN